MLQSVEGIYQQGTIKLLEMPKDVEQSRVIITFFDVQKVDKNEQIMYFGMFAGSNQSTEEDFTIAEFHGDPDDIRSG